MAPPLEYSLGQKELAILLRKARASAVKNFWIFSPKPFDRFGKLAMI